MNLSAAAVFHQQNGEVTQAYYRALSGLGPLGEIAVALFRAQKRSSRAKDYRRGKYRAQAYDVKAWSLGEVCRLLAAHGEALNFRWGWKQDPEVILQGDASWVLYVDLPFSIDRCCDGRECACQGLPIDELEYRQISFHNPSRMPGPDYAGAWDGRRGVSEEKIISFCDRIVARAAISVG